MRGKYHVAFAELLGGGWIVEKNCPNFVAIFGMIPFYLQRDRGVGDAEIPVDQANFNSLVGDLTDGYPETC